jgi:hypothetical protein
MKKWLKKLSKSFQKFSKISKKLSKNGQISFCSDCPGKKKKKKKKKKIGGSKTRFDFVAPGKNCHNSLIRGRRRLYIGSYESLGYDT